MIERARALRKVIEGLAVSLDDADALNNKELFPHWQAGKEYAIGDRLYYDGKLWIGQMYVTSDGKTRIYIHLEEGRLSPYLGIAVNGTATVEWGDGSSNSTVTGTSTSTVINTQHNYSAAGDYVIAISVSGSMVFMGSNSVASSQVLWKNSTTGTLNRCYTQAIRKLEVGVDVSIGDYAFNYCYALSNITIPTNVTSIGDYAFESCPALSSITIPANVTSIGSNAFRYCYALSNITIPANVTSISTYAFGNCYGLGEIHFKPTTPPTVAASNAWTNIPIDCIICVPYSALADYLTGTNYPSPSTYTYFGYATYNSGVTLPTQDSTQAYNVVWYATEADAKAQTNAILQGNGNEIYCICTAV